MYKRICNPLKTNNFFLFGGRGTGKSTLLRQLFADMPVLWIDLLSEQEYLIFVRNLKELESRIDNFKFNGKTVIPDVVVIDEIQRAPYLLNEIHRLIESPKYNQKLKFALTGSSARKLKRGSANMLAGRAFLNYLYPLTHIELADDFNLDAVLCWGSLPTAVTAHNDDIRKEFLRSYASIYLKEEIKEEQLVRNIEPFIRFLEVAAQSNTEVINYSQIGKDCLIDSTSVERYFQILEDTLIGFFLEPFHYSVRKRQKKSPKFYFFDLGVKKALEGSLNVPLLPKSFEYGKAFEHFIVAELMRLSHYYRKDYKFSYLRTKDNAEIDLIVERPGLPIALIEIKSTHLIDESHVNTVRGFASDIKNSEAFCLSLDRNNKKIGAVNCLYWKDGVSELGLGRPEDAREE